MSTIPVRLDNKLMSVKGTKVFKKPLCLHGNKDLHSSF